MNSPLLPLIIIGLGVIIALNAYRGIQKGGSRFYALEREAMLRRAGFTLLAAVFFFMAGIGLLIFQNRNLQLQLNPPEETAIAVTAVVTPAAPPGGAGPDQVESVPPTRTPLPTEDPNQPTPSPTPIIRRAIVTGTGSSGVYLRQRPGTDGEVIKIIDEGDVVTVLDDDPVDANGFSWLKVRDLSGDEGWTVEPFLAIQP